MKTDLKIISEAARIKSLDFLRGLAILGVVIFHVAALFDPNVTVLRFGAAQGFLGVQLFFIVSALTMCLMWDSRLGEESPALKFYIRRFFRIAPPFWLAMIFYLYFNGSEPSPWHPAGVSTLDVLMTAAFVHALWPNTVNSIVPGGWSIGVEMLFYLFFPLLIRLKGTPLFYLGGAFGLYLVNLVLVRPLYAAIVPDPDPYLFAEFLYFQFFSQGPVFLLGIALYQFMKEPRPIWPFLVVAALWLFTATALKYNGGYGAPTFWVAVFSFIVFARFVILYKVSWWPINKLGAMSYSIYLSHFAVLVGVERALRDVGQLPIVSFGVALVIVLSVCCALAYLLERSVERYSSLAGKIIVGTISRPAARTF